MAKSASAQRASQVLDEEIAALREQVAAAKKRRARQPGANGSMSGVAEADQVPATPSAQPSAAPHGHEVDSATADADKMLEDTLSQLEHIKQWLHVNPDLLPFVTRAVHERQETYVRKGIILNIVLSTIFLFAGWLLSTLATPTFVTDLFRH